MILAETLATLTSFTAAALTRAIQLAGYEQDQFLTARFLGMTNSGQFCYSVEYQDLGCSELQKTKVFLTYDPVGGGVTASY